ncbi:MAG: hypothetical protein GQ531_10885, partial [Sulfurovum sp.]|nr:hypothetical protein [Sulfurovum sp.]
MSCKTYKIGIFFDGTGNNSSFDSSNGRDQQSNIAKLHTLYKTGEFECKEKCMVTANKIYIEGIGTYDTQEEHDDHNLTRKYDKGGGGGGAKRINEAIEQVTELLEEHTFGDKKSQFKTRLIDVFGFSRGAALARDFVNTFYEDKVKVETDAYGDVRFNFIGLYDTVGSFGKPGNDVDKKPIHPDVFDEANIGFDGDIEDFMIEEHDGTKMLTHKELFVSEEEAQKRAIVLKSYKMDVVVVPYYPPTGYGGSFTPSGYQVIAKQKENEAYTDYNFNLCLQSAKKIVHFT